MGSTVIPLVCVILLSLSLTNVYGMRSLSSDTCVMYPILPLQKVLT